MTPRVQRKIIDCVFMAATVALALLPLYLTTWRDAIYDGALLVISIAFSSDALFRCARVPGRRSDPFWQPIAKAVFLAGAVLMLVVCGFQYGPIANDLRKEKVAMQKSLQSGDISWLSFFEREREEDERDLPNSSVVLLAATAMAEFGVILGVER